MVTPTPKAKAQGLCALSRPSRLLRCIGTPLQHFLCPPKDAFRRDVHGFWRQEYSVVLEVEGELRTSTLLLWDSRLTSRFPREACGLGVL